MGKLRSNMLGTQFTIYDGGEPSKVRAGLLGERPGQRQEIVGVLYDTNVLGFKGPRRMTGGVCCYSSWVGSGVAAGLAWYLQPLRPCC